MMLKDIFFIVVNAINLYVIYVYQAIKIKKNIILLILKDMILYVKFNLIYSDIIAKNVK